MGIIKEGVKAFITKYNLDVDVLNPFLTAFSITRAFRNTSHNSLHYEYFLSPDDHVLDMYGFSKEILLVYAPYQKMEPRTLTIVEEIFTQEPAKSRVENINYFLISDCESVKAWINNNVNPDESRIIIAFSTKELKVNGYDNWYIRNKLYEQYYSRDLFDITLPIKDGSYFFGRQKIVGSYVDAIKKSENRGLFGLRKSGKTSLLFKIENILKLETSISIFFYDCKFPSIRKLRWTQLIEKMCNDISEKLDAKVKHKFDEVNASETFLKLIKKVNERSPEQKIVLIFDEVEYISFKAIQDKHWLQDFVDFWQTIWSVQSLSNNLSFIICGVNPGLIEKDIINGVQNPLFGIVSYDYLKGLTLLEITEMINTLGKKMGLKYPTEVLSYLFERFGGHPLLTRKACSWLNKQSQILNEKRPITFELQKVMTYQEQLDSELTFYCGHIVSEIRDFYPEEYEMLELLSSGQTRDFIELSALDSFIKHLKEYGLLLYDKNNYPCISIPVLGRYIGVELARKEKRNTIHKIIPIDERDVWYKKRINIIIEDFRLLERLIRDAKLPLIFGFNSFPEAEKLTTIKVTNEAENYNEFLNVFNRCFVESIENYGESASQTEYFSKTIKNSYPYLYKVLRKIKVYRHNSFHLNLRPSIDKEFLDMLNTDLEGRKHNQIEDAYFIIMQKILDELFSSLQFEINKLT